MKSLNIKEGHLSLSFYMYDIPELVFPSRISFIEGFMTLVQGCDVSYSNGFYIGLYLNHDICICDPIGYLLDFTNPYYTALAGNMKARAKKDNSF